MCALVILRRTRSINSSDGILLGSVAWKMDLGDVNTCFFVLLVAVVVVVLLFSTTPDKVAFDLAAALFNMFGLAIYPFQ